MKTWRDVGLLPIFKIKFLLEYQNMEQETWAFP